MLHSELTLTRVIRGVFLRVVWTLDDTIFTVANVSTAVPKLILCLRHYFSHRDHQYTVIMNNHRHDHLHELVSALEPAEYALLVGVEVHLQPHSALGTHHGSWRGLVTVSEMLRDEISRRK